MKNLRKPFAVGFISREDLELQGYDVRSVSDSVMNRLASMVGSVCLKYDCDVLVTMANRLGIRKFKVGDKVKWHDPGIQEYAPKDRKTVLNRVFTIFYIEGDVANISDGYSEVEAYLSELEWVG